MKRVGLYAALLVGYLALLSQVKRGSPNATILGVLFWVWVWYAWKVATKATS